MQFELFVAARYLRAKRRQAVIGVITGISIAGVAAGAALGGLIPVADVQYGDFLFLAMDQLANQAAKMRYMSGGKLSVPMVLAMATASWVWVLPETRGIALPTLRE